MKVSEVIKKYKPLNVTFVVHADGSVVATIFVIGYDKDNNKITERWTKKWANLDIDVEGFKEVNFHNHFSEEYYSYKGENGFYMNLYVQKSA